jgi:hypothetical protein
MPSEISPRAEATAQKQFKYANLFERCAAKLMKDPVKGQEAYDRVTQTWDVLLKPSEKPSYPPLDPSKAQEMLDDICSMEPKSLDE